MWNCPWLGAPFGAGKIHPRMVPGNGNELSVLPPAISSADSLNWKF